MIVCLLLFLVFMRCTDQYSGFGEVFKGGESSSQFRWFATAKLEL